MGNKPKAIAKVALGLPLKKLFDYSIPQELSGKVSVGSRVRVPFRSRFLVGYCIELSHKTQTRFKTKPISTLIDDLPILSKSDIAFAKEFARFYFCSLGEAIETSLPVALRRGRRIKLEQNPLKSLPVGDAAQKPQAFINDSFKDTLDRYLSLVRAELKLGKGSIIIFPDKFILKSALRFMRKSIKEDIAVITSSQKESINLEEWLKVRQTKARVVIGTRLAIFAPVKNLGLIIVDDESNYSYKQEVKPFYHLRDVALLRSRAQGANIIFGLQAMSLDMHQRIKQGEVIFSDYSSGAPTPIQVVDLKVGYSKFNSFLTKPVEIGIQNALNREKKCVLFYNRKGFANVVSCKSCDFLYYCKNCSCLLKYDRDNKRLYCAHCNYEESDIRNCPKCKTGELTFQGWGIQKLENRLNNLFPLTKISSTDNIDQEANSLDYNILIGTEAVFRNLLLQKNIDFAAVLSLDSSINFHDYFSTEKVFLLISKLRNIAKGKLIIQTFNPDHYLISAFSKKGREAFLAEELKIRAKLKLPPVYHICELTPRSKDENKLRLAVDKLNSQIQPFLNKAVSKSGPLEAEPYKLRGNFRMRFIFKAKSRDKLLLFLSKIYDILIKTGLLYSIDIN